ncbi:hypothetical protein GMB86_02375 [Terrilactibacillus sp. BCM23-1]|uniref:CHY-type domain-containing protein n=2 Tax=Terrilactibacillus tamarindi TaxID=2599694 RepID=A0A6N8CLM9_9BACI|nr:hypothetical protein [Terrilactibacillus tamarindi]
MIFGVVFLKKTRPMVYGVEVDNETRCKHYHTKKDVIAIKFKCCGQYYSCYECHEEVADHKSEQWNEDEYDEKAILCGVCGHELTISEYMNCGFTCPKCQADFNPGCQNHYHLYFGSCCK